MNKYLKLKDYLEDKSILGVNGQMVCAFASISSTIGQGKERIYKVIADIKNIEELNALNIKDVFSKCFKPFQKRITNIDDMELRRNVYDFVWIRLELTIIDILIAKGNLQLKDLDSYKMKYFTSSYSEYLKWKEEQVALREDLYIKKEQNTPYNVLANPVLEESVVDSSISLMHNVEYGYSSSIVKLLKEIMSTHDTGLSFIPLHTGSGKSYSMSQVSAMSLAGLLAFKSKDEKIVIVSNRKSNLPLEQLKRFLVKEYGVSTKDADNWVIKINNSAEWTLEQFSKNGVNVKDVFSKLKAFLLKNKSSGNRQLYAMLEVDLMNFERYIECYLNGTYTLENIRLNIETTKKDLQSSIIKIWNQEYEWKRKKRFEKYNFIKSNCPELDYIFADISIENSKCILLSTKKLLSGLGGLLEPTSDVRDSQFFGQRCTIFMDEIDSFKEIMTNHFIEEGFANKINILKLSEKMVLYVGKFHSLKNKLKSNKTIGHAINRFVQDVCDFDEKYNISNIYAAENIKLDSPKNIFQTAKTYISQLETNGQVLYINVNKDNPHIGLKEKDKLIVGEYTLETFLDDFFYLLNNYIFLIHLLSINLYNVEKDRNPLLNQDTILADLLDELGYDDSEVTKCIKGLVKHSKYTDYKCILRKEDNVYKSGFNFLSIIKNFDSALSVDLEFCSFNETPENFLESLANEHLVIGLSATSTLESYISNFNIKYLREIKNGNLYHDVKKFKSYDDLKKYHLERLKMYDKGHFVFFKIDEKDYFDQENLLTTKTMVKNHFKKVHQYKMPDEFLENFLNILGKDRYSLKRYLYILDSIFRILDCRYHKAGLIFSPKGIGFSAEIIISEIAQDYAKNKNLKIPNFKILVKGSKSEEEFIKESKKLTDDIDENSVLFVFTTYKTAAEGLNLQYKIIDAFKDDYICISDNTNPRQEVDLDFCIFDMPTYIINEMADATMMDKIRNIFIVSEMYTLKKIGIDEYTRYIKETLSYSPLTYSIRDLDSDVYHLAVLKIIIQALGRTCRTEYKNKWVQFIFCDRLVESLRGLNKYKPDFLGFETQMLFEFLNKSRKEYVYSNVDLYNKTSKREEKASIKDNLSVIEKPVSNPEQDSKNIKNKKSNTTKKQKMVPRPKIEDILALETEMSELINNTFKKELSNYREGQTVSQLFLTIKKLKDDNFFIKHPTISKESLDNYEKTYPGVSKFYGYFGTYKKEYGIIRTKKGQPDGILNEYSKFVNPGDYVSSKSANIPIYSKNAKLRDFFKAKNLQINWKENECIMLPCVFNRFYKGCLGELIFEFFCTENNIQFEKLPRELYELADYIIKINDKVIYVDVKNYQEKSDSLGENFIHKAERKIKEIGNGKFAYINVSPTKTYFKPSYSNDVLIIPSILNKDGEFMNSNIVKDILINFSDFLQS